MPTTSDLQARLSVLRHVVREARALGLVKSVALLEANMRAIREQMASRQERPA